MQSTTTHLLVCGILYYSRAIASNHNPHPRSIALWNRLRYLKKNIAERSTDMEKDKLHFLGDNQSIASVVAQLHEYFKNSYSQYKIKRSHLLSQLDAADGDEEQRLLKELHQVEEEFTVFGILSDSLSVANRVLHSRRVIDEIGKDDEVYKVHLDPLHHPQPEI